MGQTIPTQHPAVVLRSQFNQLRVLLAIAMIAVVGLSIAVVIVANHEDQVSSNSAARLAESPPPPQSQTQPSAGATRSEGASASGKDYTKNAATGDVEADAPESLNGPGARTD